MKITLKPPYSDRHHRKETFKNLVYEVFGIPQALQHPYVGMRVQCNSRQFARFIVARNELGFTNRMQELDMKILGEGEIDTECDPSRPCYVTKWDAVKMEKVA